MKLLEKNGVNYFMESFVLLLRNIKKNKIKENGENEKIRERIMKSVAEEQQKWREQEKRGNENANNIYNHKLLERKKKRVMSRYCRNFMWQMKYFIFSRLRHLFPSLCLSSPSSLYLTIS